MSRRKNINSIQFIMETIKTKRTSDFINNPASLIAGKVYGRLPDLDKAAEKALVRSSRSR
jgi:hypothetical protein